MFEKIEKKSLNFFYPLRGLLGYKRLNSEMITKAVMTSGPAAIPIMALATLNGSTSPGRIKLARRVMTLERPKRKDSHYWRQVIGGGTQVADFWS